MPAIRLVRGAAAAAVLICATSAPAAAQQNTAASHTTALAAPRIDAFADGRVTISLVATGELRGLVTLTLRPSGSGYDGEWAFTVAHVDNRDPETGLEPEPHAEEPGETHPHTDFGRLVQRGSLSGTVSGAALALDASGALSSLSATLSIGLGTKEFAGVTGSGSATLTDLTLVF